MPEIKFGTDGWRGIIGRDFTFRNLRVVAQAIADYMESQAPKQRAILIGYDCRFMALQFARSFAEVLQGNGFEPELLAGPIPTPYVSFEVKRRQLAGGVMVTASHNPPQFCGIKFKAPFGGSATPEVVKRIESHLYRTTPKPAIEPSRISLQSPRGEYFEQVQSLVDFRSIELANPRIMIDAMHGSAGTLLEGLLKKHGIISTTIRSNPDPLFGGVFPEPTEENLAALSDAIGEKGCAVGLATDGDADRLGVMDAEGRYVNTHQVLALLILHLVQRRGWRGKVVKTVSQSVMIDRICKTLGLECQTVPIGFKNIADLMLREDILIGGEESGGVGIKNHIPERDGILMSLLMLEAIAHSGTTLSEMVRQLWQEFGEFHFRRIDLHVPLSQGSRLVEGFKESPPRRFAGLQWAATDFMDGTKLIFTDESWILFRQSGTEPLLRIYCEAGNADQVVRMITEARRLAGV